MEKRRFKLIKQYPESRLSVGDEILKYHKDYYISTNDLHLITSSSVESFPEFWEEVIQKDYIILSFIGKRGGDLSNYYIRDVEEINDTGCRFKGYEAFDSLEYVNATMDINSIKRLSDGQVFTLGERVTFSNTTWPDDCFIKSFKFKEGSLKFEISQLDTKGTYSLESIMPYPKYLFTTEDNVKIYEGQAWWYIQTGKYNGTNPNLSNTFPWELKYHDTGTLDLTSTNIKRFANKEIAINYLLLNKPRYSLKQLSFVTCKQCKCGCD